MITLDSLLSSGLWDLPEDVIKEALIGFVLDTDLDQMVEYDIFDVKVVLKRSYQFINEFPNGLYPKIYEMHERALELCNGECDQEDKNNVDKAYFHLLGYMGGIAERIAEISDDEQQKKDWLERSYANNISAASGVSFGESGYSSFTYFIAGKIANKRASLEVVPLGRIVGNNTFVEWKENEYDAYNKSGLSATKIGFREKGFYRAGVCADKLGKRTWKRKHVHAAIDNYLRFLESASGSRGEDGWVRHSSYRVSFLLRREPEIFRNAYLRCYSNAGALLESR